MVSKNILYLALIFAVAATTGSLYLSEIKLFAPCVLCWYQRILMFPLVPILAVGILRKDINLPFYVLPLSILGMAVALYQYLLQNGVIGEGIAPCGLGVSCAVKYVEWFGFITIPLLSFISFAIITIAMLIFKKTREKL
ncbi:disulfide bond formation protein B [Candidatus Microgenomates bacterium]|nr:disulfide bond formation protein B [Candidatus Microgenomates bacterium]